MHLKSIDLENFPTSETALRMMSRVSPIYESSYVAKWLYQVMGAELDEMKDYIKSLPLQRFPETATWGMAYLEKKYNLASGECLTSDERRRRIIEARPHRGTVNPYYIEKAAKLACGVDVTIEEKPSEYYFSINLNDTGVTADLNMLIKTVDKVKPSHLCYGIETVGDMSERLYAGSVIAETYGITVIKPYQEKEEDL